MKSINGDNELWTRLSVEELERREEYTSLAEMMPSEPQCCFQVCCYDCCIQVCCFQLAALE